MKSVLPFIALFLLIACKKVEVQEKQPLKGSVAKAITMDSTLSTTTTGGTLSTVVAIPNHIVIVWFENKGITSIIGSSSAPFINSLKTKGVYFSNYYALTHPSQPNYIRWLGGASNGVTDDRCPVGPFSSANLWQVLYNKGVSMRWYAESMPDTFYTGCNYGVSALNKPLYVRRHNPIVNWSNVNRYASLPFTKFPGYSYTYKMIKDSTKFKYLRRVVCVTPNEMDNMHDGSISAGDIWFKNNFELYVDWAMKNNSILICYWDEGDGTTSNRIPVILVGQHVQANITISTTYNHYSLVKSICSWWGASMTWTSNISNANELTGFWK